MQYILQELNSIYDETKIFGIIKSSENNFIAIYIPNFIELCNYKILDTTKLLNNNKIKIIDIRKLQYYNDNYEIDLLNILSDNKQYLINNYYKDIFITIYNNCKDDFKLINDLIIKVIDYSLNSKEQNLNFIEMLTELELTGLKYILSKMQNNEVIISISKAIEETNISRPVFKNLFNKLNNEKVAEINNMGVKGTSIKLINKNIIKNII